MNNEQREAQLNYEKMTGIHNSTPGTCRLCGKLVEAGMKSKCPHEQTNQRYVVLPLGSE